MRLPSKTEVYHVYFDCENQCELHRINGPTHSEVLKEISDSLGGGNYNWYAIPISWKLVEVQGRDETELRLILEEE